MYLYAILRSRPCRAAVLGVLGGLGLAACSLPQPVGDTYLSLPGTLRPPKPAPVAPDAAYTETTAIPAIGFGSTPVPPGGPGVVDIGGDSLPAFTLREAVKISLEGVPLPAFINEVFGNLLGVSFHIDPKLEKKADLVTLRVPEPQQPAALYRLARQVLETYGVSILRQGELLTFVPLNPKQQGSGEIPLLITGEALPEVPVSHRPVFQVVVLKALRNTQVRGLLGSIYNNPQLQIAEDPMLNAITLSGPPDLVRQAAKAVRVLDQPMMQGRGSLRIDPVFVDADQLAKRLQEVLENEGYSVSIGLKGVRTAITLMPVTETNSVFVFAAGNEALHHVKTWAQELDRAGNVPSNETNLFIYPVQNTEAEGLANTLSPLLQNILIDPADAPTAAAQPGQAPPGGRRQGQEARPQRLANNADGRAGSSRMVVDPVRNAILFQGQAEEWSRLLKILKELDKPAKLVLVEVTIAEVTLSNDEQFGVGWRLSHTPDDYSGTLSTLGGLSVGSGGLTYTLVNGLGQTRAMLNAFASNNRINVLSSPRVMVKSGENASINVGTEVPVLTSQSMDPTGAQAEGNSAILQQIQYRTTGVSLKVKAVVHAGNRVDLEVSQEVSQAETNKTSNISSPVILNRSIETKLSLSDGGSVLLGGLISDNRSDGSSGVPFLSDIPVLGQLFRVDSQSRERTELLVLIVPYVISDGDEAEDITEAFRRQLSFEQFDPTPLESLPPAALPQPLSP